MIVGKDLILKKATAVDRFAQLQGEKNDQKKAIATRLAINEMKLNHWAGNELEWQEIYKTVWVEKLMFVELSMDVKEILEVSNKLLSGQKKMIAQLGVIVNNTGQILQNQEIIITNQGVILDVTNQILDNTEELLEINYEILGTVNDIKGSIDDIKANGVKVVANNYSGGKSSSYIWIVVGGLVAFLMLFIILKMVKKKK